MNIVPEISFKKRVVLAFLLVPWLPLLIAVPYTVSPTFRLFGWYDFPRHFALCAAIAGFTYVLEIVVLVPAWLWMVRQGKTSVLRILTFAILVAFICGVIFFRALTGPRFFTTVNELTWLLPLMCFIGGAEALVFWLIVRPDRRWRPDGS